MALSDYSSHDWRKFTDDAVVVDDKTKMKVNESPRTARSCPK